MDYSKKSINLDNFGGINNKNTDLRLITMRDNIPVIELTEAKNVYITSRGTIKKREGLRKLSDGNVTWIGHVKKHNFCIINGVLYLITSSLDLIPIYNVGRRYTYSIGYIGDVLFIPSANRGLLLYDLQTNHIMFSSAPTDVPIFYAQMPFFGYTCLIACLNSKVLSFIENKLFVSEPFSYSLYNATKYPFFLSHPVKSVVQTNESVYFSDGIRVRRLYESSGELLIDTVFDYPANYLYVVDDADETIVIISDRHVFILNNKKSLNIRNAQSKELHPTYVFKDNLKSCGLRLRNHEPQLFIACK